MKRRVFLIALVCTFFLGGMGFGGVVRAADEKKMVSCEYIKTAAKQKIEAETKKAMDTVCKDKPEGKALEGWVSYADLRKEVDAYNAEDKGKIDFKDTDIPKDSGAFYTKLQESEKIGKGKTHTMTRTTVYFTEGNFSGTDAKKGRMFTVCSKGTEGCTNGVRLQGFATSCVGYVAKYDDLTKRIKDEKDTGKKKSLQNEAARVQPEMEKAKQRACQSAYEVTAVGTTNNVFTLNEKQFEEALAGVGTVPLRLSCGSMYQIYLYATGEQVCIRDIAGYTFSITDLPGVTTGLEGFFQRVVTFLVSIIGSVALLVMVIGGFMMVVNRGNEDMINKGKTAFTYGMISIIIVFLAYIIVAFVQSFYF